MNFVNEYVAIGNSDDAQNFAALRDARVRYIVNVAQELFYDPPIDFVSIKAGGVIASQPILPLVKPISWITLGQRVLVHCAGGWNRSPAIVICYLMDMGMTEEAAFQRVLEKRVGCVPTLSIIGQWKVDLAAEQKFGTRWRQNTMSVGMELREHLEELYGKVQRPLLVVETGCIRSIDPPVEDADGWSTLHLTRWVSEHEGSRLHSIEIHPDNIIKAGRILGEKGITGCYEFHNGESLEELAKFEHMDFAYLDTSDDLDHGLAEFKIAEEKGALMIVMDDREVKGLKALAYAKESGNWDVEERARQVIMRRK